jgi:hypothetical protein
MKTLKVRAVEATIQKQKLGPSKGSSSGRQDQKPEAATKDIQYKMEASVSTVPAIREIASARP